MKKIIAWLCMLLLLFTGCSSEATKKAPKESVEKAPTGVIRILSGSENKALEPILKDFTKESGIAVEMTYKGSLDIMASLGADNYGYDAVWPASSMWLSLGDKKHQIKHVESTSINPVVFGIKKSLAEELGFVGKEVSTSDIVKAIRDGKLRFCMTSATQSNSGASAYIGFLYALAGHPDMLTLEHLNDANLQKDIQTLLQGVDRSSGSSDWLKDMFLEGDYDAMVNYECLIIDANKKLTDQGKEPLYVVYPHDGLSIADSPLAFVDQGNGDSEKRILALEDYLTREDVQEKIQATGRRTGYEGVADKNKGVFREDWGLQKDRLMSPIPMPKEDVINEALRLYQSEFRKPSLAVYCLDFSGSMNGYGDQQMKTALGEIFDPAKASVHRLQASNGDIAILIPFNHDIVDVAKGTGQTGQAELLAKVASYQAIGGTDMYLAMERGLEELKAYDTSQYTTAIVVMSDGESMDRFQSFSQTYAKEGKALPLFSICFGNANEAQLQELAKLSNGRVFDGRTDLIQAFKSVKGYY